MAGVGPWPPPRPCRTWAGPCPRWCRCRGRSPCRAQPCRCRWRGSRAARAAPGGPPRGARGWPARPASQRSQTDRWTRPAGEWTRSGGREGRAGGGRGEQRAAGGRAAGGPGPQLSPARLRLAPAPQRTHVEHKHLDGLGEGEADGGRAQLLPLADAEAGHRQDHGGAVEVAEEGEPQVEGLGAKQGAVGGVDVLRGDLRAGGGRGLARGERRAVPAGPLRCHACRAAPLPPSCPVLTRLK